MVPTSPNNQLSHNAIQQQHERLESLQKAIENRFSRDRSPSRSLISLLNALAVHLQTHFEWEESDGYFSGIVQQLPRLSEAVDQLVREHAAFLGEVNELVTMARIDLTNNRDTSDLAERFAQLHCKLISHEHEENRLLQEAYVVDIGTQD